jgi:hypothetical protein
MESIDDNLSSYGYEPLKIIGKGKPAPIKYKPKPPLKILAGSIGRAVLCRRLSTGVRVVIKQVPLSNHHNRFCLLSTDVSLRLMLATLMRQHTRTRCRKLVRAECRPGFNLVSIWFQCGVYFSIGSDAHVTSADILKALSHPNIIACVNHIPPV